MFISAPDDVCLRRTLCGRGECEKLGVLTALEQFQYSAWAGGVQACWTFGRAVGVRIGSVEEWTGGGQMKERVSFQDVPRP